MPLNQFEDQILGMGGPRERCSYTVYAQTLLEVVTGAFWARACLSRPHPVPVIGGVFALIVTSPKTSAPGELLAR